MAKTKANISCAFALSQTKASSDDLDPEKYLMIEGIASTDNVDRHGDVIPQKAWNRKSLANYKKNPIILYQHLSENPIGKMTTVRPTDKGLFVRGGILRSKTDAIELIDEGILKSFSIGFVIEKDGVKYDEDNDVFEINKLDLAEISVVSVPSNRQSQFSLAKNSEFSNEDLEDLKNSIKKGSLPKKENVMDTKLIKELSDSIVEKLGINPISFAEKDTAEDMISAIKNSITEFKMPEDLTEKLASLESQVSELNAKLEAKAVADDAADDTPSDEKKNEGQDDPSLIKAMAQLRKDFDDKYSESVKENVALKGLLADYIAKGRTIEEKDGSGSRSAIEGTNEATDGVAGKSQY